MEIKVNFYDDNQHHLEEVDGRNGWYIMRCAENVYLRNGESKRIKLNFSIKLPSNHECHMYANEYLRERGMMFVSNPQIFRSNHNDGRWELSLFCFAEHGAILHKDEIIGEFRIMEHHDVTFKEGE